MSDLVNFQINLQKYQHLHSALHKNIVISILIDARSSGVIVPPQHEKNPYLQILLGLSSRVPPAYTKKEGVTASLLFGESYADCFFPWNSIWGIVTHNEDPFLWELSAPFNNTKELEQYKNIVCPTIKINLSKQNSTRHPISKSPVAKSPSAPILKRIK